MLLDFLGLGLKGIGGLLGHQANKSAQAQQSLMHRQQLAQSQAQFDAQMDTSVTRRVADAKKAGIHPLFAMGASVGASPTISTGGAPAQKANTAMANAINSIGAGLGVIEKNKAAAARDFAEAQLIASERVRLEQDLESQGRDHFARPEFTPNKFGAVMGGAEYVAPLVSTSQRTGVASGTNPARIQAVTEGGQVFTLPNPDLGLDEVGQLEYILGVPGRVFQHRQQTKSKEAEIQSLDRELTKLRNVRQNPQKAAQAREMAKRMKRKIRTLYNYLRSYTQ